MRSRIKLIFGTIVLIRLFIAAFAYFNIERLQSGTEWIEHSHQIIHSLQKMYANLKDTQTNYADYLLTKNKSFLMACRSGMDNTRQELGQADKLMMDDPILHKNMEELHSMVQDRIDSIQTGLAYAQAGRSDLAVSDLQNKTQKKKEQQVKQLIGQISGMQVWLLKTHKLLEENSTENNLRFMALCTLSALFICGLAAYFINRHINERQQAINLLRSSEEKLRFLAETANDSFITTDNKGNIVDLNQATETMFGYSRPELMGKSLITLMPKEFTDEHGTLSFERYASMTTSGGLKTL
jgi:CHASE3 domain sensor protein